jgi:hypothetical protein
MNRKQRELKRKVEEEAWKVLSSVTGSPSTLSKDHSLFHKRKMDLFDIRFHAKDRILARIKAQQKKRRKT